MIHEKNGPQKSRATVPLIVPTFNPHSWISCPQVVCIFPSSIGYCHSLFYLFYGDKYGLYRVPTSECTYVLWRLEEILHEHLAGKKIRQYLEEEICHHTMQCTVKSLAYTYNINIYMCFADFCKSRLSSTLCFDHLSTSLWLK